MNNNAPVVAVGHEDLCGIAREVLAAGRKLTFRAGGHSMSPFIKDGDVVTVIPAGKFMRIGDVVLSRTAEGHLLLHRVVKKHAGCILTMGDASDAPDEAISLNGILGKVVRVSGRGYNFQLKRPFNYLIARRILSSRSLLRYKPVLQAGRTIAKLLG